MDQQIRMAIRDAVNRSTRKPFSCGGLAVYQQLEAIDQALTKLTRLCPERPYLQQLSQQVNQALDKNRTLADNVKEAHQWLRRISACLRYHQRSFSDDPVNSHQVTSEMEELLDNFNPAEISAPSKCHQKQTSVDLEPVRTGLVTHL